MRGKFLLAAIVLLAGCASAESGEETPERSERFSHGDIELELLWADREYRITDSITLTIHTTVPAGMTVRYPAEAVTQSAFLLRGVSALPVGTPDGNGRLRYTGRIEIEPLATGELVLPVFEIVIANPGLTDKTTVMRTEPYPIVVADFSDGETPLPAAGVLRKSRNYRIYLIGALLLLAAAALIAGIRQFRKPSREDPWKRRLAELDTLKQSLGSESAARFYDRLSALTRTILAEELLPGAEGHTSRELREQLASTDALNGERREWLLAFLLRSDAVKFRKAAVAESEMRRDHLAAVDLVLDLRETDREEPS